MVAFACRHGSELQTPSDFNEAAPARPLSLIGRTTALLRTGRSSDGYTRTRHTPAEYRWFWSITEQIHPALGVSTNGRVPHYMRERRGLVELVKVIEAREQKEQQRL